MRVRSTGLGNQEMKAEIKSIEGMKKDSLIMRVETIEPVLWHIRIVMGPADIRRLMSQMLRPTTIFGILKLAFKKGDPDPQGDW